MLKNWQPKNAYDSILPIRFVACFFGLEIIHYPLNNPRIELSIVYIVLVTSGYIVSLYYVSPIFTALPRIPMHAVLLWVIIYVQLIIYFSNLILMWYWRNQSTSIKLRVEKVDRALERLGVAMDYPSIFRDSVRLVIYWIILVFTINGLNVWNIFKSVDTTTAIILVTLFHHLAHANNVSLIHFWMLIRLMEKRFEKINQVLLDIIDEEMNGRQTNKNWPPTLMSITVTDKSLRRISTQQNNTKETLRVIKKVSIFYCKCDAMDIQIKIQFVFERRRVHLESTVLCQEILGIFGIQIAMVLTSSFIIATAFIFGFYINHFSPNNTTVAKLVQLLLLTVRVGTLLMRVFFLNICCAETTIACDKTGRIIHELGAISNNSQYQDEIRQFSLQMTQNPVSFTACGFVTLGYEFLRSFIGSITTYVVILVQLYGPPLQ